jgi:hypothetical protein
LLRTIASVVLTGVLIAAAPASAMEIKAYDQLSLEDQSRYHVTLLEGSRQLLLKQGKKEMAAQIISLFDTIQQGDSVPRGLYQFLQDLNTARQLIRETGKPFHVEHALLLTFNKFKIEVPRAELMKLGQGFKPSISN